MSNFFIRHTCQTMFAVKICRSAIMQMLVNTLLLKFNRNLSLKCSGVKVASSQTKNTIQIKCRSSKTLLKYRTLVNLLCWSPDNWLVTGEMHRHACHIWISHTCSWYFVNNSKNVCPFSSLNVFFFSGELKFLWSLYESKIL